MGGREGGGKLYVSTREVNASPRTLPSRNRYRRRVEIYRDVISSLKPPATPTRRQTSSDKRFHREHYEKRRAPWNINCDLLYFLPRAEFTSFTQKNSREFENDSPMRYLIISEL